MNKKILKFGGFVISNAIVFCIGIGIGKLKSSKKKPEVYSGTLRVDNSDKDYPNQLFLELDEDVDILKHRKVAHFKVLNKNYIQ